jgi:hypothetical protein
MKGMISVPRLKDKQEETKGNKKGEGILIKKALVF